MTRFFAAPAAAFALAAFLAAPASAQSDETWKQLRYDVFGDAEIAEDSPLVTLAAPARAEDAAMVPVDISVTLPEEDGRTVRALTLIVDENPAPVAATFTFGQDRGEIALSTRLRVNTYSHVRAIAETSDGTLHMAQAFVKASGGCSAPAMKDADEALARLGEMRVRAFEAAHSGATPVGEAQVMIRHPNYSGLQMNQITRLTIPAMFVSTIEVSQGDETVFRMEGGISLSEDPSIRFSYADTGEDLAVRAEDTKGRVFTTTLAADGRPKS